MESPKNRNERVTSGSNIKDVLPGRNELRLVIECTACQELYLSEQHTVMGHPVGVHDCTKCGQQDEVSAEVLTTSIGQFVPHLSDEQVLPILFEASRIASTWMQHDELQVLLIYEGVNLGEHSTASTFSHIAQGLLDLQDGANKWM